MQEIRNAIRVGLKPFEVSPPLRLSEWAEKQFYVSAESSDVEQQWRTRPYQRAIMDCISNDAIEEVCLRKSARVGYTKIIVAAIAYFAQHKRRNQAVWQPTDEDSDEFVKTEIETMFRDVPIMQSVFPEFMQRHKHNTLRQKIFLGSILHLRGGKAAKNYRRVSVSVAVLDEVDGFDNDVEKEGSPIALARKRLEGATFPKLVIGSTPKLKDLSLVQGAESQIEQRFQFLVPCPHCGVRKALRWGGPDKSYGFKWVGDDASSVAHLCEACSSLFTQAEYLAHAHEGRWTTPAGIWIDDDCRFRDAAGELVPTPRAVSMYIWTAYSDSVSWAQIVREYLSAKAKDAAGDSAELKTFTNTTLGDVWEEEMERADDAELRKRAIEMPLRTVPLGALVLTCGVDVQDNRFEATVWGFGPGEEQWTVDHTVLEANPSDERDWMKLSAYLETKFPHAAGGKIGIEATAIDTGGHFTHQVYNFCRLYARRRVYAVKGETKYGQPVKGRSTLVDVNYRGKIIKGGVKLWHVGTDTAKDLFFGRLKVTQPGPGYVHFSNELPEEWFRQLTAEARLLVKTAQGEQSRWVSQRPRNEALDCTVYAIFAAHMLDLHRYTDTMWDRLRDCVAPRQRDLLALAAAGTGLGTGEAEAADERTSAPPLVAPVPASPARLHASARRRPLGVISRGVQ